MSGVVLDRADAALAIAIERQRRANAGESGRTVDPLARLMDPAFTDTLWVYDGSKVGERIPGRLSPKQAEALVRDATHRWLFYGNQGGKTTLGAVDVSLCCLGRHPLQASGILHLPPWTAWASALSWELWEKILLPELLTWIPAERVIDAPPPHRQSTKRDILVRADNGKMSRITGKAAEQGSEKYQSARVDQVWFDEEHPQAVYDEVQARLLRFRGRTLGTMTPLKGEATYVFQRIYEPWRTGRVPVERHWCQHAGVADNPGIEPAAIQEIADELANSPSQLEARLYGHFVKAVGVVYQFALATHGVAREGAALADWLAAASTQIVGMFDLGKWRFFFAWGGRDENGVVLVDEVFSQNESADTRARKIDHQLRTYGVREIMIVGECADPDEIREMNEAFERIPCPFRFWPVDAEKKNRRKGVTRVESLLSRHALRVCLAMGRGQTWRLGMSAASKGTPMEGSRWVWEANNWAYPEMPDGKVQKDDPDDASADGADAMDATRYLAVTLYGFVEEEAPVLVGGRTNEQRIAEELREMEEQANQEGATRRYGNIIRQ